MTLLVALRADKAEVKHLYGINRGHPLRVFDVLTRIQSSTVLRFCSPTTSLGSYILRYLSLFERDRPDNSVDEGSAGKPVLSAYLAGDRRISRLPAAQSRSGCFHPALLSRGQNGFEDRAEEGALSFPSPYHRSLMARRGNISLRISDPASVTREGVKFGTPISTVLRTYGDTVDYLSSNSGRQIDPLLDHLRRPGGPAA